MKHLVAAAFGFLTCVPAFAEMPQLPNLPHRPPTQLGASGDRTFEDCVEENSHLGPNPSWGCEGLPHRAPAEPAPAPGSAPNNAHDTAPDAPGDTPPHTPPNDNPPSPPPTSGDPKGSSDEADQDYEAIFFLSYSISGYGDCIEKAGKKTDDIGGKAIPWMGRPGVTLEEMCSHVVPPTVVVAVKFHVKNFGQCFKLLDEDVARAGASVSRPVVDGVPYGPEQYCRKYFPEKVHAGNCDVLSANDHFLVSAERPGVDGLIWMSGGDEEQCAKLCARLGPGCCNYDPPMSSTHHWTFGRCLLVPGTQCQADVHVRSPQPRGILGGACR